ncbi:MAG: Asp-tRNA(Asn)/Glu-tRNA(Gln) amidotransferase subunit GatC [Acidobacteriota bacterium]|nr:MAG: Asp-tRNA(Asn)/Glu-tRNA(Gln) amidotransferase subunit GatC [Acidobacteriota bacterium]
MSKISKREVEKIADLAKLRFAESDLDDFVPTFRQILDYFNQLENIDTSDTRPTYHAIHGDQLATPLREDECRPSLPHEEAMNAAPEKKQGHFRVPKVIE